MCKVRRMLKTPGDFDGAFNDFDAASPENAINIIVRKSEILVDDRQSDLFSKTDLLSPLPQYIGRYKRLSVYAHSVHGAAEAPEGASWVGLRALFGRLPDDLAAIAGRAIQLSEWDRSHRFCGACGTPTERAEKERARRCGACGLTAYPRISPAMMCLVTRGNEILLARNVNFPPGRYSALAGFLEAGESAEDAVHREVREEVGIEVKDLRYFASQSWPFPHSLMIAFSAEYASGELRPDTSEIADAQWFTQSSLPQLPPQVSIARALIDNTLARLENTHG